MATMKMPSLSTVILTRVPIKIDPGEEMFGKKRKKNILADPVQRPGSEIGSNRLHISGLGDTWLALTGHHPADIISQVVATVISEGGTRPVWQWKHKDIEYILMAWPKDQPIRAAVLFSGKSGAELKPVSAFPLLEGEPNDLEVSQIVPRKEGLGADVGCAMRANDNPLWFFDPLYERDRDDLTPGVTHTFWLGGAAFAIRRALLDYITITQGERYEAYAQDWLAKNPGKTSKDVPPLRVEVKNRHIIMPGKHFCEYQIRGVIQEIQDWQFEKMPIKVLYLDFPFDDRPGLRFPLFVSQFVLKDYQPEKGQEIEAYVWLQGRVMDLPEENPTENTASHG